MIVRVALPTHVPAALALALSLAAAGCARPREPRPNVLWIVWDTVRADHLGLYGHARPTSPNLERFARQARVFEDCLSPAGYTLPAHASLFTGLLPGQHCTHNDHKTLDDGYTTLAELLRDAGYRTFLYSANPHVSSLGNLSQGFEREEHPWSPAWADEALRIVREKLPVEDHSSELRSRIEAWERGQGQLLSWNVKATGELAQRALLQWLDQSDAERPFFAFLNYMEAHRPTIPTREHRGRVMTPEQVERSYAVDRSWLPMWEYTFGLREYSAEELELTRLTYDAALTELDDHFGRLIEALERRGALFNTVVVLTADHGEHLGEQHMLDHQYSLYQVLLRVPLVLYYPPRVPAGRDARPVMSHDLFLTLLELARVDPPADAGRGGAVSLLHPLAERVRLAEDPASSELGVQAVRAAHPDWDPRPWQRRLRAIVDPARRKLIEGSDARRELYDLAGDPLESRDLAGAHAAEAARLGAELSERLGAAPACGPAARGYGNLSPAEQERLRSLGYLQ